MRIRNFSLALCLLATSLSCGKQSDDDNGGGTRDANERVVFVDAYVNDVFNGHLAGTVAKNKSQAMKCLNADGKGRIGMSIEESSTPDTESVKHIYFEVTNCELGDATSKGKMTGEVLVMNISQTTKKVVSKAVAFEGTYQGNPVNGNNCTVDLDATDKGAVGTICGDAVSLGETAGLAAGKLPDYDTLAATHKSKSYFCNLLNHNCDLGLAADYYAIGHLNHAPPVNGQLAEHAYGSVGGVESYVTPHEMGLLSAIAYVPEQKEFFALSFRGFYRFHEKEEMDKIEPVGVTIEDYEDLTYDSDGKKLVISAGNKLFTFDPVATAWAEVALDDEADHDFLTYSPADERLYAVDRELDDDGESYTLNQLKGFKMDGSDLRTIALSAPIPVGPIGTEVQVKAVGADLHVILDFEKAVEVDTPSERKIYKIVAKTGKVTAP